MQMLEEGRSVVSYQGFYKASEIGEFSVYYA